MGCTSSTATTGDVLEWISRSGIGSYSVIEEREFGEVYAVCETWTCRLIYFTFDEHGNHTFDRCATGEVTLHDLGFSEESDECQPDATFGYL